MAPERLLVFEATDGALWKVADARRSTWEPKTCDINSLLVSFVGGASLPLAGFTPEQFAPRLAQQVVFQRPASARGKAKLFPTGRG